LAKCLRTYRLFGRGSSRPGLDVPREREKLAATTPMHYSEIKRGFCRLLFFKERDVHRLGWPGRRRKDGKGDHDRTPEIPAGCRVANAISWMLTTTIFRCPQENFRCFKPAFSATRRAYALSRFPPRNPGVGRKRQHVAKDSHLNGTLHFRHTREEVPHEEKPSSEESPLWQESARSVNSDPGEGLKRLLMSHESLVVTR
jgi:hypothetical protein